MCYFTEKGPKAILGGLLVRVVCPQTRIALFLFRLKCTYEPIEWPQVVVGVWAVANGEAISVRAYDPKAVETFDLTIVSGWWAELELPPLIAMTEADLDGLAGVIYRGVLKGNHAWF